MSPRFFDLVITLLACSLFADFCSAQELPSRGLCSHRGVNSTHPENTLPAFAEAVRLGAAMIEFDVQRTKDGQLVIMHDRTVDRTTNGSGKVAEMTFDEIRALDAGVKKDPKFAGTKIPTFDEAIDSLPRNVWVNVHLGVNPAGAVEVARKIVEKKRAHQALLACSRSCAVAAKEMFPEIKICNMERQGGDVPRYINETIEWKCEFLQLTKLGTPEEMRRLKDAGVKINYFAAHGVTHFRELVAAGVEFPLVDDFPKFVDAARELDMMPKTAPPPNIVFIMADDLGYGDLSCYGQRKFTTPNIDRLASEGMKFTQFYSGSTVCAPSRCSLMTGYHTGHCFIRGNRNQPETEGNWPLSPETATVAKVLKRAGYATGCFGKWGLGGPLSEGAAFRQGFDRFFGYYDQRNAHNYYPPFLHRNEEKIELDGKTYSHDLIEKEALDFIRENRGKPFFCYMPVTIPHAAMQVPEEYHGPWRKKFPEFEDTIGKYSFGTEVRNPIAAFPGMMTRLDVTVKRVLDLLDELGLDDNTAVFFTSDNGPHKEGGHGSETVFQSSGPLRGIKRDMYEGGIRMPMLVRWPSKIKAGSTTEFLGAFWDVLPTLADLAGTPAPTALDGLSFLPTLLGDAKNQKEHEYLYWEFYEQKGKVAARYGRWKGVRLDVRGNFDKPDAVIEVYDLETDLGETKNVAAEHPEVVERFRKIFREAHTPSELFKF